MIHENKKSLSFVVIVLVCSLWVPVKSYANKDEIVRKVLGIGGACLVAHGFMNTLRFRPRGIVQMIAGTVIGVGGICSDIILTRLNGLRKQDGSQNPVQQFLGGLQHAYEGELVPVVSQEHAKQQLSRGWDNFSSGRLWTGCEQMYDGLYHGLRSDCRRILYSDQ
jgi:hypothetical protein